MAAAVSSPTAVDRSMTGAASADWPPAAYSSRSAARAMRQAPIPRADPTSVWAAAAASAGSAPAMRSSGPAVAQGHAPKMALVDDARFQVPAGDTQLARCGHCVLPVDAMLLG